MTTTIDLSTIAFTLVRDASTLMDSIDPGTHAVTDHDYGPITLRARRVYTPQLDTLTLIAYHGDLLVATVLVANNGSRITARIHQMCLGGVLFTRHGDWGFVGIGRVAGHRRRFTLTTNRDHTWRIEVNAEHPTTWPNLDAAAHHISDTYAPTR
jgi:hypothetical protein